MIWHFTKNTFRSAARAIGFTALSLCFIPSLPSAFAEAKNEPSVKIWHWWNSEGERKSIDVLNAYLTKRGLHLENDQAQANSTGLYLESFPRWLNTSNLPDAAMMVSSGIQANAATGALLSMDGIAKEQAWAEFIPHAIQDTAKYQGHWVSVPINSHSTNWIWFNKALFSRLDLPEPETWEDLIEVLDRAKALGIPAIASLEADWEQALLFELVTLNTGGLEFYRRLFVNGETRSEDSSVLVTSFLRLKQLTDYFAASTQNLSWNQATAMLAQQQVLMQIQGSWVNSELASLGQTADVDYLCIRFPGTQGAYLFHSDHFMFFKNTSGDSKQQKQLARILLDKEFQRELSIASGAAPSRVDISTEGFNSCSKKSMHDLRMANMRHAVMASINNKYLFKIVNDYLAGRISTESAAEQVLKVYSRPAIDTTVKTETSHEI